MTVGEFWRKQQFSYLVTHSFNRGPKLAALRHAANTLFQVSRRKLLTSPAAELPALREQLRLLERTHDLNLLTLTPTPLTFHLTASPIARIGSKELAAQKLAAILQVPVEQQMHWMCGPVYRDALAFYNERDELLSVLNICFGCDQMVTDTGQQLQADTSTYQILRAYLTQLGHPIESDGVA